MKHVKAVLTSAVPSIKLFKHALPACDQLQTELESTIALELLQN